jgi:hypothetical protein
MKNTSLRNVIKWGIASSKNSILVLLVLFTSVQLSFAQLPHEVWHNGYVVLNDFDTLRGEIKYNFQNNIIQLQEDGKIRSFSAQSFVLFTINDVLSKRLRDFYSIPFNLKGNYKAPIIFELLHEGEHLTLLAREILVVESVNNFNSFYYHPRSSFTRERLDYEFYFMKKDAKIVRYNKKKRDLLYIMNDKSSEMKRIMKKKKLRHDRAGSLVRITAFYNELKSGRKVEI